MSRAFRIFAAVAFTAILGPGCDQRVRLTPRIVEFTVTPAALPPGGGPVEARWKVEQARKVFLEIDGERREVAAESSLSLSIADTTKFVLLATDFDADRKEITVPVEHINVSGTVVDPADVAVAGIEVRVNGGEPILTDAEGRFSAAGVRVPYSVRLHAPENERRKEQLWLGLKRTDIKLLVPEPFVDGPAPTRYPLRITWTGGGVSAPAGAEPFTQLLVFSADGSSDGYLWGAPAAGSGTLDAYLDGPASRNATVILLQGYTTEESQRIYQRASAATTVWADSASVTDVPTIALDPVETPLHPVEIVADSWLKRSSVWGRAELPGMAPLESIFWWTSSDSPSFTFPVPPIQGAAISLTVNGWATLDPGGRVARTPYLPLSGSDPLVVPITVPPDLLLPMYREAFAGTMSWSRPPPGPCRVTLMAADGELDIHTDGREVTLADLDTAGYALKDPFSSWASWQVSCPDGFASLDDAMADLRRYSAALNWNTSTGLGWSDYSEFYVP